MSHATKPPYRPGDGHERARSTPELWTPRPTVPLDEATLLLRTLRMTVPLRRPAAPSAASPAFEAPLCRTVRLRLPPRGPTSPCHPDALRAAPDERAHSARQPGPHIALTRRQWFVGVGVAMLLLVVPLTLRALRDPPALPSTPEAVALTQKAIPLSVAPFRASSPVPPSSTPSAAPSARASPVRRVSPAPKPRLLRDIVNPWGE